jgi:predicted alpha/beta-hydrolase family hydrolase
VSTPYGDGRLVVAEAPDPVATLLLSHGAGNGIESHDLAALMAALPARGVTVAGFDQPWRVAGRCLAISFPLHPPGRPEKTRLDELSSAGVPTLLVQGERDAMGRPDEFPELADVRLEVVPWADHGLKVPKAAPLTLAEAHVLVVDAVASWIRAVLLGNP